MKDAIFLLLAGVGAALVSWAFWHFAASDGFYIFSTIAMVFLAVDNIRLRRQLRDGLAK